MTDQEQEQRPTLPDLLEAIEASDDALVAFIAEQHPADLADWLGQLDEETAWDVYARIDADRQVEVFDFADVLPRARCQVMGQAFDVVAATPGIDDPADAGLLLQLELGVAGLPKLRICWTMHV